MINVVETLEMNNLRKGSSSFLQGPTMSKEEFEAEKIRFHFNLNLEFDGGSMVYCRSNSGYVFCQMYTVEDGIIKIGRGYTLDDDIIINKIVDELSKPSIVKKVLACNGISGKADLIMLSEDISKDEIVQIMKELTMEQRIKIYKHMVSLLSPLDVNDFWKVDIVRECRF